MSVDSRNLPQERTIMRVTLTVHEADMNSLSLPLFLSKIVNKT